MTPEWKEALVKLQELAGEKSAVLRAEQWVGMHNSGGYTTLHYEAAMEEGDTSWVRATSFISPVQAVKNLK